MIFCLMPPSHSSNTKRLCDNMRAIEKESAKFIPKDSHYIIKVVMSNEYDVSSKVSNLFDMSFPPLSVYTSCNSAVYLLYSCVDEFDDHYMDGNQQHLCCFYMKEIPKILECEIDCIEIVELQAQSTVCTYFSYIVFETMSKYLLSKSSKITKKDIAHLTLEEVITKSGIKWNKVSSEDRFGKFVKRNGNTLSELFDLRETEKYKTFLFSS